MILRFCQSREFFSELIFWDEHTSMPFTPSHCEAVTPKGLYLGARMNGGVQARKPGYDADKIAVDRKTGTKRELFLMLPATEAQDAAFYAYLTKREGSPYDWRAIIGFVYPGREHTPGAAICSAFMVLALRAPLCEWLPFALTKPAHLINPDILLLMISSRIKVPM